MTIALEEYTSAKLNLSTTPEFTNLANWRLKVVEGAQTWHYLDSDEERKAWPQTTWDKYHLGLPIVNIFQHTHSHIEERSITRLSRIGCTQS
jgi:lanosterol synthase